MEQLIKALEWRYATKKYDTDKKVSYKDIELLKKAVQLSASSIGLQPYKVYIIESPEMRIKLKEGASGNNANLFADASHIFIIANELNLGQEQVDRYIANIASARNQELNDLQGFNDYISNYVNSLSLDVKNTWTAKQTYIALGNLLSAAALLKIDATPMEGFDPATINKILGIDAMGLSAAVIATIGYRHEDDVAQNNIKVRKPEQELFITL